MTILEYLESVKAHLLTNLIVEDFRVVRERMSDADGHLRARVTLAGGVLLEFSEYIQLAANDEIAVITYSYHCSDSSGNLIVRWDNTPHFPDLPGFPHHRHTADSTKPQPWPPMNIFKAMKEIKQILK